MTPPTTSSTPAAASPAAPVQDPLVAMSAALTPKRAVSYIRVSTREQAQRAGAEEGFSIPAQREANKKKAASMGALIVKEFVDRGESARSANRPELQRMLAYLQDAGDVDYVIVHKLDRLARNRADDVEINRAFEQAGVRLVSTSENIDQTPGGILLHGIMSSIAEFYSRNLVGEVLKGMGEKARSGGTIGKAPLGYRNVRGQDAQGREIRTVEVDPERGPLMRLAFSEYATGNWTVARLAEHLAGLGLDLPATPTRPAKPLSKNRLHTLLRHPYYRGVVSFQGVEYPGQHEPLVDAETWQQVQDILDAHRHGEQQRLHNHHLKTTVVCGLCGSRLLVHKARSRHGRVYPYFVCARRHRTHDCAFRAVLIEQVEARVAELYGQIHLEEADRQAIEAYLLAELERIETDKSRHIRSLTTRRTSLEDQRRQLLQAHYAGAIPLELLKEEQSRLTRDIHAIQRQLDGYQADATLVRQHLAQALDLLEDCARLYTAAPEHLKKQLNTVFFQRVLVNPAIDEDGRVVLPADPRQPEDGPEGDSGAGSTPAGQTTPATHAAGETDAASPEAPSTSPEESDPADLPTSRSGAGAAGQQTTRRGAGATGHHAASQLASPPGAGPVLTQDPEQRTTAAAILSFPFDHLASPALHRIAHQHTQTSASTACQGPADHGGSTPSSQRKTPTHKGEHTSSTEASEASEAFTSTAPHHAGSYSSTVVRLGDIDTNKWAPLLRLRDSLVAAEETDSSDHAHSDNRPGAAPLERPRAGAREEHDAASTTARAPGDTVHRITNPRNRPLSSQSREQIRRLADSGLSAPEVAMRHGVHEGTVRAIWREQHRPRRQGWRRFSDEDRQRAEQMVSQGMTLIEVGLALGFDRGTVRKHIRDRTHH